MRRQFIQWKIWIVKNKKKKCDVVAELDACCYFTVLLKHNRPAHSSVELSLERQFSAMMKGNYCFSRYITEITIAWAAEQLSLSLNFAA